MLRLLLSNKITLPRTFRTYFRSHIYKMSTLGNSTTLIIEQTNPLENASNAKYDITIGNTTFTDFILSYPSGAYTGMRTVGRDSIVEFHMHMQRVTNSVSHIHFKANQTDEKVKNTMASFSDIDQLKAKVLPMLKKGLSTYYEQVDSTTHSTHPAETKVSIMVTYSPKKELPLFAAHFSQLSSIPKDKRVKVEIKQALRHAPELKDSQWVRDRAILEKNMPKDVNEVILVDDKDQLYEGMSSNFLAVKLVNDKPVVICASLDHILLGSILKIVISICKKHDIEMKWDFPRVNDAKQGKWIGCFIASTSRLLLPVETIYVDNQSIEFKESAPVIEFLRSEVLKEMYNTSCKIL